MRYHNVFVLGGTSEGRQIVSFLEKHHIPTTVSVTTSYGEELLQEYRGNKCIRILQQCLNEEGFTKLFREETFDLVVDASHPYAKEATKNCVKACLKVGLTYKRILRESIDGDCMYFETTEEIVEYLEYTKGNVLLTTGSKELEMYTKLTHFQERIYIRMLPIPKVLEAYIKKGYPMSHFICMQGPFSKQMNKCMIEHTQAKYLITKDSGYIGGTDEKLEAAAELGVTVLCLKRPLDEQGMVLQDFYKEIEGGEDESKY